MKITIKDIPNNVVFGVTLIFISVILTALRAPSEIQNNPDLEYFPSYFIYILTALVIVLSLFKLGIATLIITKHNWARIVFLVICILGLPLSLKSLILVNQLFHESVRFGLSALLYVCIDYFALGFLYTSSARVWFKNKSK
jgi:hypothetical protein